MLSLSSSSFVEREIMDERSLAAEEGVYGENLRASAAVADGGGGGPIIPRPDVLEFSVRPVAGAAAGTGEGNVDDLTGILGPAELDAATACGASSRPLPLNRDTIADTVPRLLRAAPVPAPPTPIWLRSGGAVGECGSARRCVAVRVGAEESDVEAKVDGVRAAVGGAEGKEDFTGDNERAGPAGSVDFTGLGERPEPVDG